MGEFGFFTHIKHPIPKHKFPSFPISVFALNEFIIATIAGIGMFSQSYILFAIGNITNIWKVLYPECFQSNGATLGCSESAATSATFVEVSGLILGMLTFGILAQKLGRRWASRSTATLMFIGGILLVSASGVTLTGLFVMSNVGLLIFGIGSGGEYPTAAASAAERAALGERQHFEHRGRLMVLTFAMQGWGNVVNTAIICLLLALTGNQNCLLVTASTNSNSSNFICNDTGLNITWRVQYAIGLLFVLGMLYHRYFKLKESELWKIRQQQIKEMQIEAREKEKNARDKVFKSKEYITRLISVAACWYLWDVAYYGNKLFQGTIISATLGANHTLMNIMTQTLANAAVALVGNYLCALCIDRFGRTRIQGLGFAIVSILFLICGFQFTYLASPEGIRLFQALYFVANFFSQFGPNSTTFLVPSESFPTDVRTKAHGISASCGQLGSLTASLLFTLGNHGTPVAAQFIFIVGGFTCLLGFIITVIFVPDTTHLTLKEVDRKWECRLLDEEYSGPAMCWETLSFFECWMFSITHKHSINNLPKLINDGDIEKKEAAS